MTPVEELLEEFRAAATDEHDKGARFEDLMLHAFQTDRIFEQQFTKVWRWMDWPNRSGADIGVDLVATDADGRLIAIQRKCYDPDATLTKHDIDSFVALSGQKQWARRIIASSTYYDAKSRPPSARAVSDATLGPDLRALWEKNYSVYVSPEMRRPGSYTATAPGAEVS